jgi:hypothetical protein
MAASGSAVGTGANLDVKSVGFRPRKVQLWNVASGDRMTWVESMPSGYGFKEVAAGAGSYVTTGGISPLVDGFRLGTDSDMNVNGESLIWHAEQ